MKKSNIILIAIFTFVLLCKIGFSQTAELQGFINIYPKNHSKYVNTTSPLIFHARSSFNHPALKNLTFSITGSKSGFIATTRKIAKDSKTMLVKPDNEFVPGETIQVKVYGQKPANKPLLSYTFTVTPNSHPLPVNNNLLNQLSEKTNYHPKKTYKNLQSIKNFPDLPDDFPQYYVSNDSNPQQGNYFVNALSRDTAKPEYNLIIDTTGFPVFYQYFPPHHRENFFTYHPQVQQITYFDEQMGKFVALNNNMEKVNTYESIGYVTDVHELVLDEDGSFWLFGYDTEPVDMSQIYPGGCTSALVTGTIIQKIDGDLNLVFQWSSWDHFSILDADTGIIDLTKCYIDYCHGNALSFDSLGNILLSSRNMSEITKIDVQTGNIIWRMGGSHNQFTFTNDTVTFKGQHNIKYLGNNLYSMFDNGNSRVPPYTRAITYQLDEVNMTATLVEDFQQHNPPDFTPFMGSNQRLDNGSHLIGWAFNRQKYSLTQFDVNGNVEFEIKPVDTFSLVSYRATKYVWETSLLNFAADTLDFGTSVVIGDSAYMQVCLANNSENPIEITGYYCTDSAFTLASSLPLTLDANSCDTLSVCFKPVNATPVSAVLSVYHQTDSIRIACQTRVLGGGIIDNIVTHQLDATSLVIVPNPSYEQCTIAFADRGRITQLKLFSIDGKLVRKIAVNNLRAVKLSDLKQGAYLVQLTGKQRAATGKLIVR